MNFNDDVKVASNGGCRAKWITRSTFSCLTGRWRGPTFPIDPNIIERVTECAVLAESDAILRYQVRADNSEGRVTVAMAVPV